MELAAWASANTSIRLFAMSGSSYRLRLPCFHSRTNPQH